MEKGERGKEKRKEKKKKYGETLPPTVIFVSAETLCHVTTTRTAACEESAKWW